MDMEKHSGYGIVSFILSSISMISFIVLFTFLPKIKLQNPELLLDEASFEVLIIGLVAFVILIASGTSLGFGIAGLFQKNRKKVLSRLGTIFSLVVILLLICRCHLWI